MAACGHASGPWLGRGLMLMACLAQLWARVALGGVKPLCAASQAWRWPVGTLSDPPVFTDGADRRRGGGHRPQRADKPVTQKRVHSQHRGLAGLESGPRGPPVLHAWNPAWRPRLLTENPGVTGKSWVSRTVPAPSEGVWPGPFLGALAPLWKTPEQERRCWCRLQVQLDLMNAPF